MKCGLHTAFPINIATNRKCILALQLIAIIIFCKLQESAFIVSNEALAHPFFYL